MSSRNPFRIYRDRIRQLSTKAYRVHGMRDSWKIAEYCNDELEKFFSPNIKRQAQIAMHLPFIINIKEQMDFDTPDFFRDLDLKFALRKKSECIELQDVGLEEMLIIDRQKEKNAETVTKALAYFRAHCAVIRPFLEQHPNWRWGDACDWLEKHTGFPDIKM